MGLVVPYANAVLITVAATACGTTDSPPTTVTLAITDNGVPKSSLFVAFQDDDLPWQRVTGVDGKYIFEAPSGRYSVAWVCEYSADFSAVSVLGALVSELPRLERACNTLPPATVAVTGSVVGIATGERFAITLGPRTTYPAMAMYSFTVPPGTYRPIGLRLTIDEKILKVIRRPTIELTSNQTLDFDFTNEGFTLESFPVSVTILEPNEQQATFSYLHDDTGAYVYTDNLGTTSWSAFPASQLVAGDIQVVEGQAVTANATRYASRAVTSPSAQSFLLPMPLRSAEVNAVSGSLRATVMSASWADYYGLFASQYGRRTGRLATKAYVGDASLVSFDLPDLSDVDGWNPSWSFALGIEVSWILSASSSNQPLLATGIVPEPGWETKGVDVTGGLVF